MSLVGPRPLLMEYLPLYDGRQARRHEVRPGHHRLGAGERTQCALVGREVRARRLVRRAPVVRDRHENTGADAAEARAAAGHLRAGRRDDVRTSPGARAVTERAGVFVFGASGHAKVVIDAIERAGRRSRCSCATTRRTSTARRLMGYPIVGGREALLARRGETSARHRRHRRQCGARAASRSG